MSLRKLVLVIAIAALLMACAQQAEKPVPTPAEKTPTAENTPEVKEVEIPIGVLVDLSGPLTTYGEDIKATVEIAKDEINKYFEEKGKPYRVKVYVEDTRVDPKVALDKVQALHGKGVRLIIGPMGSGEVKNIADYVTANKIIIISPSSTAIPQLLGITKPEEKKFIFRFVAPDTFQTKAIAKEVQELGIKGVVITYVGNAWGKGLADAAKPLFEEYGIEVAKVVEYPDPPPADFSQYINAIEDGIKNLADKYGTEKIAVVAFSYEETYTMLSQIPEDSILLKVMWIGCDGNAYSRKITEMCDRVNAVKMYSTLFESKGDSYEQLNKTYYGKYGRTTYQYGLDAYDAAWVLALSFAQVYDKEGKFDPDAVAEVIPKVTEEYSKGAYGVTPVSGFIKLNEWNDRASGNYAIWGVEDCQWVLKGIWKSEKNEVEWK
ncbi:amino acid/amide ABC transporter substrate-binding protein, HAAT family [Archaeoglobus sulfaticallidus PM70-1]|uniref:Amino acid/amide ABC transporter substrate-binding protein, HAAT family n=1 Tax=Archaeoglobus sulfaticallidus PM70-1 TaxID=387631 RepID=N0BMA4_9EURY|nr:ABC transporter substrate-binding protein [Archaeoglobus sulfaticallidus]AGK61756.1 amino acid/amide ABC transporter substrate-binding protein, HAAT family [Archaeoglobus sulfaticallidus PM70-1]